MRCSVLLIALVLLAPLAAAQSKSVTITASAVTTPSQIGAGESGTMDITLKNVGNTFASDLRLTIFSSDQIEFKQTSYNLGNIEAGSSKTISVPITVKTSLSGTVAVRASLKYGIEGGADRSEELSVPVSIGGAVILRVSNITYSEAVPGKDMDLFLDIENAGRGNAANVKAELTLTGLPFVPVEGDVIEYIQSIAAGSSRVIQFKLQISKDSDIKAYAIPVSLVYEDSSGKVFNATRSIGVKLSGKTDLVVLVDRRPTTGPAAKASIAIANRGNMPAEFLTAYIDSPYGSKTSYVGKIDPDDYNTIDVEQDLRSGPQKYEMTVRVTYKDSYSNDLEEKTTLEIEPMRAPRSYTMLIIAFAIIAVLAIRYKKII